MSKYQLTDHIIDTSYRLFGFCVPELPTFRKDYNKSGIKLTFESYLALSIFILVTVSTVTLATGLFLQSLFKVTFTQSLMGALVLVFISSTLTLACLIAYPLMRINRNKNEIDSNLIYTVGYMSVLSAGGLSIERIFDRVVEVEPRATIKDLALRFTTDIKLFGSDMVSSLKDIQVRSASEVFAKLLVSIASTSKTSGDLKSLLTFETSHLLALKREQLKKRLASMVALAELYVTAMVMAPVTFIIMITLLSVLGNSSFSLSPITQLNLIVFFGIPAICIVFIVILDGALPKED